MPITAAFRAQRERRACHKTVHVRHLDALRTVHLWDLDALAPVWRDASVRPIGYMFVREILAVRLCDLISAFRRPLPWRRDLCVYREFFV